MKSEKPLPQPQIITYRKEEIELPVVFMGAGSGAGG